MKPGRGAGTTSTRGGGGATLMSTAIGTAMAEKDSVDETATMAAAVARGVFFMVSCSDRMMRGLQYRQVRASPSSASAPCPCRYRPAFGVVGGDCHPSLPPGRGS